MSTERGGRGRPARDPAARDRLLGLDGYDLIERIAEGGMGAVYRVRHRASGTLRVAKLMHRGLAGDPRLVARFEREAQLLGGLRHPHVARLHEVERLADGDAVLIMEHVDGMDLGALRRHSGRLPASVVLALGRDVADALDLLHGQGWIHRDLSPDNLMARPAPGGDGGGGPGLEAVLIDLGIAKAMASRQSGTDGTTWAGAPGSGPSSSSGPALTDAALTTEGGFLGKVRYSSPEQLAGKADLDGRSDLYTLGVVLYELLTGRCPIEGSGPDSWVAGHLLLPPKSFSEDDHAVPPPVRELVLSLLAKTPRQRPRTARALADRLAELAADHPPTPDELDPLLCAIEGHRHGIDERVRTELENPTSTWAYSESQHPVGQRSERPAGSLAGPDPGPGRTGSFALAVLTALVLGFLLFWAARGPEPVSDASAPSSNAAPIERDNRTEALESRSSLETVITPARDALTEPFETPSSDAESARSPDSGSAQPEGFAKDDGKTAAHEVSSAEAPSPRPGRVELDAAPWAELVAIRGADGRAVESPVVVGVEPADGPRVTPLAVVLLPGRYGLTLRHPGLAEPVVVDVEVDADTTLRRHVDISEANQRPMSAEDLLQNLGWPRPIQTEPTP